MAERAEIVLSASDRTAAAFASAQRNLNAFGKGADSALAKLRGFTAGVTAISLATAGIAVALNPQSVIDYADELNKLSQRTGIAVEDLSALDHAAKLAGVSTDELAASLKRLNLNIAAAARGEKEQADAFKAIGVSVVDANGKVRSADKVLADIADRFASYEDGPKKVAIANAIGGKSFEALIPLLNGGSKAMRDAREELEKLGGVISGDLARQSEKFNDNLTRIGVALNAAKVALAGGLIDRLVDLSDKFIDAVKNGTKLEFVVARLKDVFSGRATLNLAFGIELEPDKLQQAQSTLAAARAEVERLHAELAADPDSAKTILAELERVEDRARAAAKEVAKLQQQVASGQVDTTETARRFTRPKPDAPDLPNKTAASEALANLKKTLDGNLRLIATTLGATQDVLRHHEQVSQALLDAGVQSLDKFYADQDNARQDNLAAIREATDAEIAERQRLLNSPLLKGPDKAAERAEVRNQIAAARANLAAAERDAAQQHELATLERRRAVEALRDELKALDAQIRDLASGGNVESDLLDIARRVREAGRSFVREGDSEAEAAKRAAEFGRLLELQRQFNIARDNFARITTQAADAEELLLINARQTGAGLIDTEDQVHALRAQSLQQLEALIATTRKLLAQNPENSALQDGLRALELQAARTRESIDPRKLRLDAAGDDIGATLADGLQRAAIEGDKLRDIINDIGRSVSRILFDEIVTKPLAQDIGNLIKGAGGKGTGQNLIGQLFGLNQPQQAGPQAEAAKATAAAAAEATAKIAGLGTAAGGSSAVLGKLPELAAIPATTALGTLAAAAEVAAANLLKVGASETASQAGEALAGFELGQFFAKGGYTGNAPVDKPVGVVEGKEFVFSAPAVRAIGVPALEELHRAARDGTALIPASPITSDATRQIPTETRQKHDATGSAGAAGAPGAPGGAASPARVAIQNLQQIGGPTEAAVLGVPVPGAPGQPGEAGAAGAPAIAVQNLRMAAARAAAPGSPGEPGDPGEPGAGGAAAIAVRNIIQAGGSVAPGLPAALAPPGAPGGPGGDGAAARIEVAQARAVAARNILAAGLPGLPGPGGAAGAPGADARPGHVQVALRNLAGVPGLPGAAGAPGATSPVQIAVGNLMQTARAPAQRRWEEMVHMHTGGIVGRLPDLKQNEVPLIAERGEEVLRQNDPRHRDNFSGDRVTHNTTLIVQATGRSRATALQEGEALFRAGQIAAARNG